MAPAEPAPVPTVQYDRDGFYQKLSEVEGRLTELYYIDHATAYLEQVSIPGPAPGNVNVPEPESNAVLIEVPFGQTVPFVRSYWIPKEPGSMPWDSGVDFVWARLDELADGANGWTFCNFQILRDRVERLTYVSADAFTDPVHRLQAVHDTLSDDIHSNLGNLGHSIVDWEGDAATNFNQHVYAKFPDLVGNHETLVAALAAGIVTLRAIVESAQHSLMNAVHYTSDRLYQQLELRSLASSGDDAQTAIAVLGAAASVVAAVVSGSGIWGVGMEAVAAGTSIASTSIPDDLRITFELFGATAEAIFDRLDDATLRTVANAGELYGELNDEVRSVLGRIGRLRSADDGTLVPVLPALVDGVTAETFRLPDG
jgi:hypothetical protein